MKRDFKEMVYMFVSKIPKGNVSTYKEVARGVGCEGAFRAVGNVLNKNKDFKKVPCHRVVKSNGFVGEYVFGQNEKIKLLKREGVEVVSGKIDLNKFLLKRK